MERNERGVSGGVKEEMLFRCPGGQMDWRGAGGFMIMKRKYPEKPGLLDTFLFFSPRIGG